MFVALNAIGNSGTFPELRNRASQFSPRCSALSHVSRVEGLVSVVHAEKMVCVLLQGCDTIHRTCKGIVIEQFCSTFLRGQVMLLKSCPRDLSDIRKIKASRLLTNTLEPARKIFFPQGKNSILMVLNVHIHIYIMLFYTHTCTRAHACTHTHTHNDCNLNRAQGFRKKLCQQENVSSIYFPSPTLLRVSIVEEHNILLISIIKHLATCENSNRSY